MRMSRFKWPIEGNQLAHQQRITAASWCHLWLQFHLSKQRNHFQLHRTQMYLKLLLCWYHNILLRHLLVFMSSLHRAGILDEVSAPLEWTPSKEEEGTIVWFRNITHVRLEGRRANLHQNTSCNHFHNMRMVCIHLSCIHLGETKWWGNVISQHYFTNTSLAIATKNKHRNWSWTSTFTQLI